MGGDGMGFSPPQNSQLGATIAAGDADLHCRLCPARSAASDWSPANLYSFLTGLRQPTTVPPARFTLSFWCNNSARLSTLSLRVPDHTRHVYQPAGSFTGSRTYAGMQRDRNFFRVALPMARPALAVGISLALLETLNDIGASEFLGVQTLTVTVYTTWISRSDLSSAAQIASMMLMFIFFILTLEFYGRRKQGSAAAVCGKFNPRACRGGAAGCLVPLFRCRLCWVFWPRCCFNVGKRQTYWR